MPEPRRDHRPRHRPLPQGRLGAWRLRSPLRRGCLHGRAVRLSRGVAVGRLRRRRRHRHRARVAHRRVLAHQHVERVEVKSRRGRGRVLARLRESPAEAVRRCLWLRAVERGRLGAFGRLAPSGSAAGDSGHELRARRRGGAHRPRPAGRPRADEVAAHRAEACARRRARGAGGAVRCGAVRVARFGSLPRRRAQRAVYVRVGARCMRA